MTTTEIAAARMTFPLAAIDELATLLDTRTQYTRTTRNLRDALNSLREVQAFLRANEMTPEQIIEREG